MTLQQAYEEWVSHRPLHEIVPEKIVFRKGPMMHKFQYHAGNRSFLEKCHYDGACCTNSHFYMDKFGDLQAKEDSEECPRERAWRKYIRIRDGQLTLVKGKK